MSVMNGFRTELISKILGFNPHIIVKSYDTKIDAKNLDKLGKFKEKITKTAYTFSGQAIILNKENTIGVLVRSYLKNDINKIDLIKNGIIDGSLNSFEENSVSIGKELAISLNLVAGDTITLMSTANLQTPFGSLPLREKFIISSVFSSGLAEFDQNVIFMPFNNANSLFELYDTDIDLEIILINPDEVEGQDFTPPMGPSSTIGYDNPNDNQQNNNNNSSENRDRTLLDFEDQNILGVGLSDGMMFNAEGGGHLFCEWWDNRNFLRKCFC